MSMVPTSSQRVLPHLASLVGRARSVASCAGPRPFRTERCAFGVRTTAGFGVRGAASGSATEVTQDFIRPAPHAGKFIDLARYPIERLDSKECRELVRYTVAELDKDGCCVLPGFLTEEASKQAIAETEARGLSDVYYRAEKNNIYFSDHNDPSLSEDHPARILQDRSQGFIAGDSFDDDTSVLKQVFFYRPLTLFLSEVLGVKPLYLSEDPLSGVVVSVQKEGHIFPWHFDGAEFIATICLQRPDQGGLFQYAPNIRTQDNENLDDVRALLQGDLSKVKSLDLQNGDLQIFKGKYSAHRVTAVEGPTTRYLAAYAWTPIPGYVNTVERNLINVGRAVEANYERSKQLQGDMLGY